MTARELMTCAAEEGYGASPVEGDNIRAWHNDADIVHQVFARLTGKVGELVAEGAHQNETHKVPLEM